MSATVSSAGMASPRPEGLRAWSSCTAVGVQFPGPTKKTHIKIKPTSLRVRDVGPLASYRKAGEGGPRLLAWRLLPPPAPRYPSLAPHQVRRVILPIVTYTSKVVEASLLSTLAIAAFNLHHGPNCHEVRANSDSFSLCAFSSAYACARFCIVNTEKTDRKKPPTAWATPIPMPLAVAPG